jgi:hypothetical protein
LNAETSAYTGKYPPAPTPASGSVVKELCLQAGGRWTETMYSHYSSR